MKEEMKMHFGNRRQSGRGIAGFVLAIVCAVALLVLCILSTAEGGNAGSYIGAAGMLVLLCDVAALVLSMKGMKEREVYTTLPLIGMGLSGVLLVILFCFYITGLV